MYERGLAGQHLRTLLTRPDADFEEILAPDATISTFMAPKGYRGPDGMRQYWADGAAAGWEIEIDVGDERVRGEKALAAGTLRVRRGPVDESFELTWGVRLEDGLVQEYCVFTDSTQADLWLAE
jgi:hypothetical protein